MQFFYSKSTDMFKDEMTLPGQTLKVIFEEVSQHTLPYVLFSKAEKDVHALVRKNLVGVGGGRE